MGLLLTIVLAVRPAAVVGPHVVRGAAAGCEGETGESVHRLSRRHPPRLDPAGGLVRAELEPIAGGGVVVTGALLAATCEAVVAAAEPLLAPELQDQDSVDGGPEFQLDLLDPRERAGPAVLALLWPALAAHLLPGLRRCTGPAGPLPLRWRGGDEGLRVSEMFIRRYHRPPRGVDADPTLSRWRIGQHQDGPPPRPAPPYAPPSTRGRYRPHKFPCRVS
jgi:hypothetical protein